MSAQDLTARAVDRDAQRTYRVGGFASLAIGATYVVIIALYAAAGVPPKGGAARLDYLVGKTTIWWAIVALSVLTNFLYVPVALSLYLALEGVHQFATLVGVAFVGLFVILENAVNWTLHGSLIMLSGEYAATTSESQRAILIAAATFASSVLDSPLAAVWAIGTLSFGFLLIGLVMLKGVFTRPTAYVGIVTGLLGMLAVAGVAVAVILNAVFATIWLFLVGHTLYRLGQ